jgi:RNA polymerase sigma-70 factor, ECF subfamily
MCAPRGRAFRLAAERGDAAALARRLAEDAVLYTDGGGRRAAALNPLRGSDKIQRFYAGLVRKAAGMAITRLEPARLNELPGFILVEPDGTVATMALQTEGGRITAIYVARKPDKLRHIAGVHRAANCPRRPVPL